MFRAAFSNRVVPALLSFDPELIIISAGFDGRRGDPVGGALGLDKCDYEWVTRVLVTVSENPRGACKGRIVRLFHFFSMFFFVQ